MLSALLILLAGAGSQDSVLILRSAREAQGGFERARRGQLPISHGGSSSRCDERIGQFCYWYDAREADPPPEGPAITAGREALLVELGAAAQRLPADSWLAGQRVRYLLEARRSLDAQRLAADCARGSTWCGMLLGWALHAAGEVLAADSAFARALATMPEDERCRWLDLGLVLPAGQSRAWRRLPCPERAEQAEQWLELGRGLMALPGNSVRTELLSRQVIVRVVDGTVTPYGTRFDAAHREMVLRYGWPVGWSRVPGRWASEEATIVGHDPSPAWGLLPAELDPPRWDNAAERPRARFQPPGVTALLELDDVQMARFPRGAGMLLVAAWAVPPAHPLNTPGSTGVVSVHSAGAAPQVVGRIEEGRVGRVSFPAPGGATLSGLELLHPGGSIWAVHREYWPAPLAAAGAALSDLLLFEPDSADLPGLDAVLPRAIAGTTVRRGSTVGVYWEWRALPSGPEGAVTRLEVTRERGGSPVLAWSWPGGGGAGASGAATMELNLARLGAGRYHLDVIMSAEGRVVRSRRPFQVR